MAKNSGKTGGTSRIRFIMVDSENERPGLFLRIWPIGIIGATGIPGIIGAIVVLTWWTVWHMVA